LVAGNRYRLSAHPDLLKFRLLVRNDTNTRITT
jgi:hypothetical protein